jgi:hypothetical protein
MCLTTAVVFPAHFIHFIDALQGKRPGIPDGRAALSPARGLRRR